MDTEAAETERGVARASPARVMVVLAGERTKRRLADDLGHFSPTGEASVVVVEPAEPGDPVAAASDALARQSADEVLIVATAADRDLWLRGGQLARARASLPAPVRLVVIDGEEADLGAIAAPGPDRGVLPKFSEGDLAAITLVLVGSIAGLGALVILIFRLLG